MYRSRRKRLGVAVLLGSGALVVGYIGFLSLAPQVEIVEATPAIATQECWAFNGGDGVNPVITVGLAHMNVGVPCPQGWSDTKWWENLP